ncbi:hypothetical protein HDU85_001248 [Gaertneriomyces sp. JEL0708]|nr:hypothetical protein HDU85_001248 [Gaertneriomyces sp. JEL0708]
MVSATLTFVQSYSMPEKIPQPAYYGWSLACGFLLVYLVFAAATSQYFYYVYRGATVLRGTYVEMIYRKILRMDVAAAKELGGANATNLMSVDIERIVLAIDPMHQLWSSCITIGIGLYILYIQLGASFVAALVVSGLCMIVTPLLSRNIDTLQNAWSSSTDKRVRLIGGIIAQIKGIKLSAYETPLMRKVGEYRLTEIAAMRRFWKDFAVVVCVTNTAQNMLALFSLGTYGIVSYLSGSGALDTNRMFTSYTVLNIIAAPLFQVGQQYGTVLAAYSSLKRIETFLRSNEKSIDDRDVKKSEQGKSAAISIKNATVGWTEATPILSNMSTEILKDKLNMIIGRVGCGKSTFLQAILKETGSISGEIVVYSTEPIAYCSQNVWLQGGRSIKENIVFGGAWDAEWYNKVVKACGLDIDFSGNDDRSAKGLSGGQRARIALARAVYSRASIVLLDDVFSALDVTTEAFCFEALFGNQGLLKGTTVVLVTNGVHRLERADWIVMLSNGAIAEQGTPSQLLAAGGRTSALIQEFAAESTKIKSSSTEDPDAIIPDPTELATESAEEELESIQQGTITLATYASYIRAAGPRRMMVYFIFLLLTVGIQIFTPIYLQLWSSWHDRGNREVGAFLGGYAAVEVIYGLAFTLVFYWVIMTVVPGASKVLHEGLAKGVLSAGMSFFDASSAGQIINRFSQDIFIVDFEFPLAMHDWAYETTRLLGSTICMIVAAPLLAVVVAVVAVVFFFVQRFYLATSRQLRRLDMASKSPLYSLLAESADLDGLITIRAFRTEKRFLDVGEQWLRRSQKPFYQTNVAKLWLITTLGLLTTAINTALVLIAVANRFSTSAGLLAVGLVQAVSLQDMINLVVVSWTALEIAAVAIERVQEFTNIPPEETLKDEKRRDDDGRPQITVVCDDDKALDWPTTGAVRFDNVVARYVKDGDPVLKGVSFDVPGGERIGVCGRTGSGKSTVLLTLFRMLEEVEGKIEIDGKDITALTRCQVRDAMTIIPQDPFVLDMTVRENLDPAGGRTDQEIWDALDACHLKPIVSAFESQLSEPLTPQTALSRGQRQLLSLARALLRRRKIVVMDEATGSLDVESDKAVQQTMRDAFKGCTVICVAHRVRTIEDFEWVVVLEKGTVVEKGDMQELKTKAGGAFRALIDGAGH